MSVDLVPHVPVMLDPAEHASQLQSSFTVSTKETVILKSSLSGINSTIVPSAWVTSHVAYFDKSVIKPLSRYIRTPCHDVRLSKQTQRQLLS